MVNEVVIDGGDRWGDLDAEEYAASRAPVFAGGVATTAALSDLGPDVEVRIKPLIAATFPLAEIVAAQEAFLTKRHVGKIVLAG